MQPLPSKAVEEEKRLREARRKEIIAELNANVNRAVLGNGRSVAFDWYFHDLGLPCFDDLRLSLVSLQYAHHQAN